MDVSTTTTSGKNLASVSSDNKTKRSETLSNSTLSLQFVMEQLIACQISVWYPIFSNISTTIYNEEQQSALKEQITIDQSKIETTKRKKNRKNVTIRSIILNVPNEFIQYMKQDGLILPDNIQSSLLLLQSSSTTPNIGDNKEDQQSSTSISSTSTSFQLFHQQIDDAMNTLYKNYILDDTINDRAILPKLNWSAPKDSIWINTGTMKCCTVGDIYILLKASDFISNDIHYTIPEINNYYNPITTINSNSTTISNDINNNNNNNNVQAPQDKVQVQLCLRKWCYLHRCQEFRCFISNTILIGICQRDTTQYYNHLQQLNQQEKIITIIQEFLVTIIIPTMKQHNNVLSTFLHRCIMDVYIDTKDTIWLIDFNVWDSTRTDSLLFTWDEIESIVSSMSSSTTIETANTKLLMNNDNDNKNSDNMVPLQGDERSNEEEDIFYRIKFGKCSVSQDVDNTVSDDSDSEHQINDDNDDDISLSSLPIFRVVEIDKEVRVDPLSSYRAPIDTLYVASATTTTTKTNNSYGPDPLPASSSTSSSTDNNQREQDNNTPTQFDPKCFDQFMKLCYAPGEQDENDDETSSTSTHVDNENAASCSSDDDDDNEDF